MGFFGALLSRRAPTIYDLQDIFPDTLISSNKITEAHPLTRIFRIIERQIYRKCTYLRVISKDMAQTLAERDVQSDKISVIYNWVDENKVTHIERANNPIFDQFNLDRSKFYICYAGNIGLLQNLSTLIATAEMLKNEAEIRFVIIGDGAWKPDMLKLIDEKNLTNVRTFPMQPPELVPQVYNLGDVGVVSIAKGVTGGSMPSKTWSILSAARPLIAEADQNSELSAIITNNQCGISIAPNDAEALAAAIKTLHQNPQTRKQYGENGRKFIEDNLARKPSTKKIYDLAVDIANI